MDLVSLHINALEMQLVMGQIIYAVAELAHIMIQLLAIVVKLIYIFTFKLY